MEIVSSNDIVQTALRPTTTLKCKTYQTKWNNYSVQNNISHIQPEILYRAPCEGWNSISQS